MNQSAVKGKRALHTRVQGKMYSLGEEIFNAVTHGLGAGVAVAALVIMLIFSIQAGSTVKVASSIVYGTTLILLYTMSTLYHAITHTGAKRVFRIIDHCSIYLLIAGTYTPYTLVALGDVLGWTLFGVVWACAILGIVLNAVNLHKFKVFSMVLYLAMGWAVVFAFSPMLSAIAWPGMILLLGGGACYMIGIIFYALKKWRYMHGVWHVFVLAGSVLHYLSVLLYVIL